MRAPTLATLASLILLAGCQSGPGPGHTESDRDAVPPPVPLRAIGQEPGWILDLTGARLSLSYEYGQKQFAAASPERQRTDQGYRYTATDGQGQRVVLYVQDIECRDSMSGKPYPYTATLRVAGQTLNGCAGRP